jgi:cellulose biosynthesis protein BcsQ
MTHRLRCYSFHSVKGGVGKSTLSTLSAIAVADAHPEARVYLVDMDLTGTSLADVLRLEAPCWDGVGPGEPLDLLQPPTGFHTYDESRTQLGRRGDAPADSDEAYCVPFLNDYLLFTPQQWDDAQDIGPIAIGWRLWHGPDNLRVFPSSALPRDLSRALPVIYDEEHAAFLEGRLEYLLAALLAEPGEAVVIFDTPPTIPGLSRSVLNLAFRLSRNPKTPLSEDGFIPEGIEGAQVDWRAFLVATQDLQDIRAAARWLDLVGRDDTDVVRLVLNRVSGDEQQRMELLYSALRDRSEDRTPGPGDPPAALDNPNALVSNPIWVEENVDLQSLFRGASLPPVLHALLRKLDEEPA